MSYVYLLPWDWIFLHTYDFSLKKTHEHDQLDSTGAIFSDQPPQLSQASTIPLGSCLPKAHATHVGSRIRDVCGLLELRLSYMHRRS